MKLLTAAVIFSMLGCGLPSATTGSLDSEDPAAQLYAITRAGRERDAAAVPRLIELLESDDPAVRMMSIGALERITGARRGYDPYASPVEREIAVDNWRNAWKTGDGPEAP